MGSFTSRFWPQVLLHLLLLQLQSAKLQASEPMSLKLRRLNEQFHQFKASAQARLDMLALNQNKTSSQGQRSRVSLNNHSHHMSQDLDQLKRSTAPDIDALREWRRRLEKKNKRMDARLALMERKLREKCQNVQEPIPNPGLDFSNLTLLLQRQEERQARYDEMLRGLKGLQESMKKLALRVTQLEGQFSKVLQGNKEGEVRGPTRSHTTAQKHYESQRRMMDRGGMSRMSHLFDATHQPDIKTKFHLESHSKPKIQHPEPKSGLDFSVRTMSSPHRQEQIPVQSPSYLQRQTPLPGHERLSLMQPLSHHSTPSEHGKDLQDRMGLQRTRSSATIRTHEREKGQEGESDTNLESSVIRDFLQIPMRHKIPEQPLPRKDAVVCNVDSMLLFPSASAENYVTFSVSLPDLPELSLCLWLRVEAAHVGTLLSYATDDNDNQLVLYGRRSSTPSTPFPLFSDPSHSFSLSSASSSPSLDFVIGDPVYRRLPVASLLDARWHHLCVVWSSIQGRFWHYGDRYLTSSGSNFRKGWEIPGGGSVVLGQEQDSVGGGFDPAEGFVGQVAGFRMWNRVLSASEVEGVADGRGVPRGVVLGMEDIKEVHGAVEQVACECLEHCV